MANLLTPDFNMAPLAAEAILAVVIILAFLLEMLRSKDSGHAITVWAPLGALLALAWVWMAPASSPATAFHDMVIDDGLYRVMAVPILVALLLSLIAIPAEIRESGVLSEYIALLNAAALGMLLMVSAHSLMIQFLGLELFSLALYLLCIFLPDKPLGQESGLKYFITSSLASAILLYGMAMIYGATGSTWLTEIGQAAPNSSHLLLLGIALAGAGLGFKVSAVPLHLWTPDVYQGAPTPVTGFMSVATKTAALAALIRLFPMALGLPMSLDQHWRVEWWEFLWALAGLSMIVGNLVALAQTDLKRLLAYSGIANAGYLLMGVVVGSPPALQAVGFYLMIYSFANLGAFAAVQALETDEQPVTLDSLTGLSSRQPMVAAVLAVCLVSLAGLPPTGGFLGKFVLIGAALHDGQIPLAVTAILTSFLGAAYYLKFAIRLFALPVQDGPVKPPSLGAGAVLWACLLGTLGTGLLSGPLLSWIHSVWS